MRASKTKFPQLTRRAIALGGGSALVSSILLARLYHLQFLQADRYKTLAEGNRIKLHLTPPLRGVMVDRYGVPLATNEQNYRMLLRTDQTGDMKETLAAIDSLVPIGDDRILEVLKRKPGRYAPPVLLKEFLSWDDVAKIEFHSASIPGVMIEVGQVRYYPFGEAMSHVLGYVGTVAESDLDDRDLLKLPDFKVGKDGVEKALEQDLRGKPGVKEVEVNVHNIAVRELNTQFSTPGKETLLTIDAELQIFTHELLAGESAGCVTMDVETGDVLCLVSTPSFDPNRFSKGISSKYWKELQENKKVPLMNKATSGQYPPGSTFKMLVGLAGLENKTIGMGDHVYCPGHFMLGNHRFNCWKPGGHGSMNIISAIAQSCDTYFYTVANRMGIQKFADMAKQFGLGEHFDLPVRQKSGVMPDPKWKMKSYKQSWQGGDTINASIGQGYVLATPLQLAVMTARIANGGRMVMPRLLLDEPTPPVEELPLIKLKPENIAAIQRGMAAVTSPGGTGYGSRIADPLMAMAGKTGTSQVRKITVRGQDQSKIPWEARHHAWFVAYAPIDKPKYACALLVEHGGGGASAAAPKVRDILLKAQHHAQEKLTSTMFGPFPNYRPSPPPNVLMPEPEPAPEPVVEKKPEPTPPPTKRETVKTRRNRRLE